MANKKLCIIWKWKDLKDSNLSYDINQVHNTEDHILRIHEDQLDGVSDWVQDFCNSALTNPESEFIVLCHHQEKERFDRLNLFIAICQEKCQTHLILFGGGKDFIYYDKQNKTGLINQTGGFQKGFIADGKKGSMLISVIKDNKILFESFKAVWDHYSINKYKAPIYTYIREKLLLEIFTMEYCNMHFLDTLRSWLVKQPKDVQHLINELVAGTHPVFLKKKPDLMEDPALIHARQEFINLLDKTPLSSKEIRRVTENLLKSIAGPIY